MKLSQTQLKNSRAVNGYLWFLAGVISVLEKLADNYGVQTAAARKEITDVRRRLHLKHYGRK